ncbi:MAG: SMC-Scp complex subunit ScpB [Chloroflexi bacterium]|nr:SMC-Scp complex subunit ScpB [Chloroflexota bacterium]
MNPKDPDQLPALIESLLFVAEEPVTIRHLQQALDVPAKAIREALQALEQTFQSRGVRIQRQGQYLLMISASEAAPYIERFLGLDLSRKLSPAALETLAVVAYRQPVTRAQVEAVRGVDCQGVLRTLVAQDLIMEVGRLEQAGRPILYGTTFEFLQYFGLKDLAQLPPLEGDLASLLSSEDGPSPLEDVETPLRQQGEQIAEQEESVQQEGADPAVAPGSAVAGKPPEATQS